VGAVGLGQFLSSLYLVRASGPTIVSAANPAVVVEFSLIS
jgi:hypothetical protein